MSAELIRREPSQTTSDKGSRRQATTRRDHSLSAVDVISGVPSVDVNHWTSHLLMQSRDRSAAWPLRVARECTTQALRGLAADYRSPFRVINRAADRFAARCSRNHTALSLAESGWEVRPFGRDDLNVGTEMTASDKRRRSGSHCSCRHEQLGTADRVPREDQRRGSMSGPGGPTDTPGT